MRMSFIGGDAEIAAMTRGADEGERPKKSWPDGRR